MAVKAHATRVHAYKKPVPTSYADHHGMVRGYVPAGSKYAEKKRSK